MDLLEYQGKQLFARYDIPVSPGEAVTTVDAAVVAADRIGFPVVVKAQVQVGGRGKAGGIKIAATTDEVRTHAGSILGMDIKGHTVGTLWIERASDIAEEYYASFTLDRGAKLHLGMLSAKGGVDIEAVAADDPDAIARVHIDPVDGLTEARARDWVRAAKLNPAAEDGVTDILIKLYRAYTDGDADLAEINPLVFLTDGQVHALDAKVSLDSNAAFRHPEWDDYEASQELDAREQEAREKGLQYIGLDGSVGVICNGAGMTMATLDVVNEVGGSAANFLDVGGGAGADVLANAIEVVNHDPGVRAILVNIFGGITKCDEVALGIVEAMGRVELRSPIVVRLDGTNAAEGRIILDERASDMLVPKATMLEAARTAVELAGAKS
jgi:succinyl-CoA synthetase beta subunit